MGKWNVLILMGLALAVSVPASAAITHRFDFEADPNDVIAGVPGTLTGNAVVTDGSLVLDGTDNTILEMAGDQIALNTYSATTLEMWFTPTAEANAGSNTMLAYFGGNNDAADWMGIDYLYMASANGGASRTSISIGNTDTPWTVEDGVNGPEYDDGIEHHMAVTLDATDIALFIDGQFIGRQALGGDNQIGGISQELALLGRGGYLYDPEWNGSIQEFRIYDKALTPSEVTYSYLGGEAAPQPLAIRSTTPAYGALDVSVTPTLSWTSEPGYEAASYTLYFGTDPNIADPNVTDAAGYSSLVVPGLTTPSYTFASADALENDTDYYWRVDTETTEPATYAGGWSTFTTISAYPTFVTQPEMALVDAGDTAVLTAGFESVSDVAGVQWFKAADPDVEVTAGGDVTIVTETVGNLTTTTLTIANADAADEGAYYVKAANTRGAKDSNSARIVLKSLVAYWPFDGSAADASGNGYDGTPMGTPGYLDGEVGQAIDLDGTEDYVDLPDGFDDFSSGLTFSVWAYPRTAANWARFFTLSNGSANDNIFWARVGTGADLRFQVYDGDAAAGNVDATGDLELNTWQMFTVTMDPDGNTVVYKNGVEVASGTVTVPNVVTRTENYIGQSTWPDALYDGLLDELRIYNYAMTAEEAASLYVTDTPEDDYVCVSDTEEGLAYDLNDDCRVDLADVVELLNWWLECERYPSEACTW